MKKTITIAILGILMLATALSLYAGENYTFQFPNSDPVVYFAVGNSSDLEGLTVYQEEENITISIVQNFCPDNFTLVFINNLTKEIIMEIPSKCHSCSGGSSNTVYKDKIKYIDNPIEVIKIVNQTKDEPTDLIPEKNKDSLCSDILIILGVISLWFLIIFILIKRSKNV